MSFRDEGPDFFFQGVWVVVGLLFLLIAMGATLWVITHPPETKYAPMPPIQIQVNR